MSNPVGEFIPLSQMQEWKIAGPGVQPTFHFFAFFFFPLKNYPTWDAVWLAGSAEC